MRVHALRLTPGTDLRAALEQVREDHSLRAGFIITCVGSLPRARLRMPGAAGAAVVLKTFDGPLEIVSLTGTLGPDGPHLHLSIAGMDGVCVGGHLVSGCIVHTTAELVIGEASNLAFPRRPDPATGYRELEVQRRSPEGDT